CSTLSATVRSSTRSWARKTLDMPPEPTSCSSSYRPATTSPAIMSFTSRGLASAESRLERVFPCAQRLLELCIRDHERDEHPHAGPGYAAGDEQQAPLERLRGDAVGELLGRPLRRRIGDKLDGEHGAEAPNLSDLGPALLPVEHAAADDLADRLGALEQV